MNGLTFFVEQAEAIPFAASPTIAFRLRIANRAPGPRIDSIALRCQIQIDAQRRRYKPEEQRGLRDLFGEPDRWAQTLRPLLWTHAGATVPAFTDAIDVDLPVACTFDFNVAAAKYFYAIEEDDVPLIFQFSGTIFFIASDGAMQIAPIGWDKESRFRLPARVWRDMMNSYYPDSAWLRISRAVFDRLHDYKQSRGIPTWEQAIESLLPAATRRASS